MEILLNPDVLNSLWLGTRITLALTLLASVGGLALGLVAALAKISRLWPLRFLAVAYIEVFRGTPLLVQLFFLYFALPQLTGVTLPAFTTAAIGLSLFAGAYTAEIVRGSLNAVAPGQLEAATALGLKPFQVLIDVQLPQATRIALPALGNQFIGLIKDSSLASVITVTELLLSTRGLVAVTFQPVALYAATGLIYFLLSNAASRVFAGLEHRLNRPYRTATR
ncbi:amino acid ABC transporter permease [Deinococcus marmoris]|uniref:amino acid ABC transporter permease n=1 Tax=Deinococcus marmoris TaxID=249408 RepID=UPI00069081CF|nr:amino acid ABC transporter permease [Deinococcus marmoris]